MPSPPATITEARAMLAACPADRLPLLIRRLSKDPRAGVRTIALAALARLERQAAEETRLERLAEHQRDLHALGFCVVAGIDEVGRGALAGPVTACAVVLAGETRIEGLDDSKRIAREVRPRLADLVRTQAVACSVGHASPEEIDRLGIGHATRLAWSRALEGLAMVVDHVLVDGNDPGALGLPTTAIVKGDALVACIAAASVVAKVERDRLMVDAVLDYPGYGFDLNFGYGTPEHMEALGSLGPSPFHRLTFAPCMSQERLF
jgi:ribonuclease HII